MGKAVPLREPAALPLVLPPAATRTWESVVSDPTRYFVTSPGTSDKRRFLQEEQRTMEVFERSAPSVVHITTSSLVQQQFSLDISEIPLGTGSGFVWDDSGHIVTNYHVVRNAQRAKVALSDNTSFEAKLVGAEPDKDLAVLHIDTSSKGKPLVPLTIGSSHSLRVGQKVSKGRSRCLASRRFPC